MAGMLDADYQAMLRALGASRPPVEAGGEPAWAPSLGDIADLLERNRPVHPAGRRTSEGPPLPADAVRLMDFELPDLPRVSE